MSTSDNPQAWLSGSSPAEEWEARATQRVLDELFCFARQYRRSDAYNLLLDFVASFRSYSPFNALLVRAQMQGARFVAPAHRWIKDYGRTVKSNATPLVILQTMGPVMFVFDVSDTEPGPFAKPLPPEVDKPFEVRNGRIVDELDKTINNAKRDGIRILSRKDGSQSAGAISPAAGPPLVFDMGNDRSGNPKLVTVPTRYEMIVSQTMKLEAQYATVVHELAHLYCGHIGTPNSKWWPDRRGLEDDVREFEAESVAYLVCARLGIDNPSETYLAGYLGVNEEVPDISLDLVMKSAGLIEKMAKGKMTQRSEKT